MFLAMCFSNSRHFGKFIFFLGSPDIVNVVACLCVMLPSTILLLLLSYGSSVHPDLSSFVNFQSGIWYVSVHCIAELSGKI